VTAEWIIAELGLARHPEGGWYRQTWVADGEGRPSGTCIYFLLARGERSHWHRVDAVEIWHFYAGAPLELRIAETDQGPVETILLGNGLEKGERPQGVVPAGWWQGAGTTGDWTLVGCTVSPGFRFEGFELASPGFDIP
jgi:predicted cupin superfamily sugar epimerase